MVVLGFYPPVRSGIESESFLVLQAKNGIRANLNRDTNYFLLYLQIFLQRYISQIYLCNGKTIGRFLYVHFKIAGYRNKTKMITITLIKNWLKTLDL